MEEVKKELLIRITKLLSVKSLTTLTFTFTFAYMTVFEKSVNEQFLSILLMIVGFYYGTQAKKE